MKVIRMSLQVAIVGILICGIGRSQSKAQNPSRAIGLRAGYGTDPDQVVMGFQAVLGRTLGFMRFAPSADIGFGDDVSTYLLNADFRLLSFSPPGSSAGLYGGCGATVGVFDNSKDGSDTEIGLNVVTGLTFPMGRKHEYTLEVRFGLEDMPKLRILFGFMLGGRSKTSSRAIEIKR